MALWKRSDGEYWAQFTAKDGARHRVRLGTTDEREARRLQRVKIAEANRRVFMIGGPKLHRLGFMIRFRFRG